MVSRKVSSEPAPGAVGWNGRSCSRLRGFGQPRTWCRCVSVGWDSDTVAVAAQGIRRSTTHCGCGTASKRGKLAALRARRRRSAWTRACPWAWAWEAARTSARRARRVLPSRGALSPRLARGFVCLGARITCALLWTTALSRFENFITDPVGILGTPGMSGCLLSRTFRHQAEYEVPETPPKSDRENFNGVAFVQAPHGRRAAHNTRLPRRWPDCIAVLCCRTPGRHRVLDTAAVCGGEEAPRAGGPRARTRMRAHNVMRTHTRTHAHTCARAHAQEFNSAAQGR